MTNAPKYISYNGVDFCRDEKTGYYLNSVIRERLHRYVWGHEAGPIPPGFEVHHIDGDKANNDIDNLCLLTARAHRVLHASDEDLKEKSRENIRLHAQPAAVKWHGSEEGRAWHSEHAKRVVANLEPRTFVCEHCGKEFSALPIGVHKFCSNACKAAARRASGADDEIRVCEICGKEFATNKYSDARFCSRKCMGKYRTQLNDAKRAAGIPARAPKKKK